MRFIIYFVLLLPFFAFAQPYSSSDSLKAKAYFDSSWNYRMTSDKHQLYLDSALQLIPTHAWYWQQKSMPYYKSYKYEAGRPFLDSAVKYDPKRWLDYCAFMECIFERNYQKSLNNFYKARALYGNQPVMDHPYNFYIGICHLQLNHMDSSEYYFKGCIEEARTKRGENWIHHNHLFYLGIVYFEKEEYTKAINCFDQAIILYNRFSDAQFYKALCLEALKKPEEALATMEAASVNYNEGYGFNEDSALYEYFPYQLRKYHISMELKAMREATKK